VVKPLPLADGHGTHGKTRKEKYIPQTNLQMSFTTPSGGEGIYCDAVMEITFCVFFRGFRGH
jgi:hypothetical protein